MIRRGYAYIKIEKWNVRGYLWQKKPELTNKLIENQIGIVTLTETKKKGLGVEEVDDGVFNNMNVRGEDEAIVAAYGTIAEKDEFSNQFQETIDEYQSNVMVMGNLNGRMGSNHAAYREVVRSYGECPSVLSRNEKSQSSRISIDQEIINQAEALGEAGLVELWKAFKQILLEIAEQVCGKSRVNKKKEKRTK
ncbi:hypothetical protein ILUMI_12688 [Ignelater luminosus]|uniref:Uncharacterized protein n=1 Tax=Ignelater luminosus TaxID=2038154 RepID=A0A8K0G9C0_IGNLU|nr:hypothetical protein ILUMI_12688 [Ignelater luminosus]